MGAKERYKKGMERFCRVNFGTSDLEKCREELADAYKDIWGK